MYPLLTWLLKVPSWAWMALAVALVLLSTYQAGKYVERAACADKMVALVEAQAAAQKAEESKRRQAAANNAREREESEKRHTKNLNRLREELKHVEIPNCAVPADAMRLLDEAGGSR
jgi:hypothetical protein